MNVHELVELRYGCDTRVVLWPICWKLTGYTPELAVVLHGLEFFGSLAVDKVTCVSCIGWRHA